MNELSIPNQEQAEVLLPNEKTKFIESKTAREVLAAFEVTGLKFHDFVLNKFQEAGDFSKRYGNGFAALSRYFLNALVESKDSLTRIKQIFADIDEPDYYDIDTAEQLQAAFDAVAQQIQLKLQLVSSAECSEPAKYLISLILQVCRAQASSSSTVETCTLWKDDENARGGSCKDTETYYTNALGFPEGKLYGDPKLFLETAPSGEPLLLVKKNFGAKTALTLRTLVFDGVELAPGHVVRFIKKSDGTFFIRPLRATAFSFSPTDMLDAFGSQAAEAEEMTSDVFNRTSPDFYELHQDGWLKRVDQIFGIQADDNFL